MAKALLKFRCYKCDKLLGISASKAGRTTTCPNCQADLIVPEPVDREIVEAIGALVPSLDVAPGLPDSSGSPSHDPGFSWDDLDESILKVGVLAEPAFVPIVTEPPPPAQEPPAPEPPPAVPDPVAIPTSPPPEPLPWAPEPEAPGAVVPPIEVEAPKVRTGPTSRRRPDDVVLSQAVIASWSIFVLVALGVAFVAGVLVGHYLWKAR